MESLPWPAITAGSGGWLIAFAFVMYLLRGKLHTETEWTESQDAHKRELDRVNEATAREVEDANHERSEWRTEARLKDQTVAELSAQNKAMLDAFGPTLTDFLEGLRRLGLDARGTKEAPRDEP